ncbi:sodium ion-translocating decarboxylase subunit beta [Pumilibacter intestinalis]|uniref:sodium ion-translocating decarboxylase subunit beta n=1 Tax=Pumilibacter intestinalis TaxID=2941511 RepID=UPI00203AD44C|nr:sodium ion-translocating decarboxylase subunit beta [Pumilibacter intestinalis]MCI8488508.1 sodium ion-translocating decarboxylase subunit beta [Clostridia bacterium]
MNIIEMLKSLWQSTGFVQGTWQNYVMILVSFVLFYLAIARKFEPLLLLPIAFGMLMVNIPGAADVLFFKGYGSGAAHTLEESESATGGLFYYLYQGVDKVIYPPLIFLGIGAMTDFGPLIANPKSLLIGAGAQLGIFITFFGAILLGFKGAQAASIAIIGGADGPTAIYLNQQLSQMFDGALASGDKVGELLPAIAIAAYSYMALIPAIQPPIMKLLTTKKERAIRMEQLRPVSKKEKIIFPIVVVCLVAIILPQALPLVGCLMLGNLLKESTVTERLAKTASNELINIVTIILGLMVGAKAIGPTFLKPQTLGIIALGLIAFSLGTVGGILVAKIMNVLSGGKINPLIGSAGVSAVPMAARVSQKEGQKYDPDNYLLMHAMGPNVAGVIGSAVAAGVLLAIPW